MMQKRGAYNLKNFLMTILMIMVFMIGSWAVFATHTASILIVPNMTKASTVTSFWFNITNDAGSANSIDDVRITRPTSGSWGNTLNCTNTITGWAPDNSTAGTCRYAATSNLISAGSTLGFIVTGQTGTSTGNYTWNVETLDDSAGDVTWYHNTSVDASAPTAEVLYVTDNDNITLFQNLTHLTGDKFFNGSDISFFVQVNDTGSSNISFVELYYGLNSSNKTDRRGDYDGILRLNISEGNNMTSGIFNATNASTSTDNVSFIFSIFANDTMGNYVVKNNTNGYIFIIDKSAPNVTSIAIGENDTGGVTDDYLVTSTADYNISATIGDRISNVTYADIRCTNSSLTGSWNSLSLTSSSNTYWNIADDLNTICGATLSDNKYTITFRAFDNATNKNESESFVVTVDNDAPKVFDINSNTSYNFTANNATDINITLNASDYLVRNVTIWNGTAPKTNYWNMTLIEAGSNAAMNGSSSWVISLPLSNYSCPDSTKSTGAIACTLKFNATDILGRTNTSENITIWIDTHPPNVTNKVTTNQSDEATNVYNSSATFHINITTVDNIARVVVFNNTDSAPGKPVSFSNSNFNNVWWNETVTATDLGCTADMGTCTIHFNSTDKASNVNSSETLDITIDDSAPHIEHITTNLTIWGNRTTSSTSINISARNVSDRLTNITEVLINITSTSTSLSNATSGGFNWNVSSTPATLGCTANAESNCTIQFTARDLVRNKNSSETMKLVVDDLKPRVFNLTVSESSVSSTSQEINIRVAVNDSNLNGFGATSNVTLHSTNNLTLKRNSSIDDNTFYWSNITTASALGCTSDGTCTITVNATDDVGNKNNSISTTFQVDTSAPTVSAINVNPNPTKADANVTVTAILRDAQGVNGSRAYLDGYTTRLYYLTNGTFGGTEVNVSGKVDLTAACGGNRCGDGTHTVYVQANTSSNQWGTASNYTFTVDAIAPGAVSSFTAANVSGSNIRLSWTAASDGDTGSGVASYNIYRSSSTGFTPTNTTGGNQIVSGLTGLNHELTQQDGTYYYLVTAVDAVGNEGTKSSQLSVAMDRTAPTGLSILIANNSQYTNLTNPTLTLFASGADLMFFSCNGAAWSESYSYAATSTAVSLTNDTIGCTTEDGTKTVYFKVNDTWGNNGTLLDTDSITLDTGKPTVMTGVSPTNLTTDTDGAFTWNWTAANDNLSGIDYYEIGIDKNSAGTFTNILDNTTSLYYTRTGLEDGKNYTLRVRAFDKAGNSNAWVNASTITIDATAPGVISIAPEKNTATNDTTPTYTLTVDADVAKCIFRRYINGGMQSRIAADTVTASSSTCSFTSPTTLSDGDTIYATVTVNDSAGNTNSEYITLPTYTIDISKPMVNISSPLQNNVTTTLTPTITFNITDEVSGSLINSSTLDVIDNTDGSIGFAQASHCTTPDNGRAYGCSFTASSLTDDKKHNISISGRDKANNVVNLTRTFIVNTTVAINATLVASDTTGTADSTYGNGWSFTFNISTGTGVNATRFRMNDWTLSGTTTTMEVDGNTYMSYTDNTSTTRTYQVHNTYNDTAGAEEVVYPLRDDSAKSGKQSQVVVYVKIPTGTTVGSYTTSYAFGAYTINASGVA